MIQRWTDANGDYIERKDELYSLSLNGEKRGLEGWLQPGVRRDVFRNRCYRAIEYGQTRTVEEIIYLQSFGRKKRTVLNKAKRHRELLATQDEWNVICNQVLRKKVMTL